MFAPAFAMGIAVFACGLFAQAGYAKLKQPDAYRQPLQEYLGIRALPAWAPRAVGGEAAGCGRRFAGRRGGGG